MRMQLRQQARLTSEGCCPKPPSPSSPPPPPPPLLPEPGPRGGGLPPACTQRGHACPQKRDVISRCRCLERSQLTAETEAPPPSLKEALACRCAGCDADCAVPQHAGRLAPAAGGAGVQAQSARTPDRNGRHAGAAPTPDNSGRLPSRSGRAACSAVTEKQLEKEGQTVFETASQLVWLLEHKILRCSGCTQRHVNPPPCATPVLSCHVVPAIGESIAGPTREMNTACDVLPCSTCQRLLRVE